MPDDDKIPRASGRRSALVAPAAWEAMRRTVEEIDVKPDPLDFQTYKTGKKTYFRIRREDSPTRPPGSSLVPFHVTLGKNPDATYYVTVDWGYVSERLPGDVDAIEYHQPDNMYEKDGDGAIIEPRALVKHAITIGQACYIKIEVDANGNVVGPDAETPAVEIVVDADEKESIHYIPKVDDETPDGDEGTYYIKLALLKAGTPPILEKWMTGSHIEHYQELPSFKSTLAVAPGIGVVPKKWDNAARHYKIRALSKGLGKNNITTNADEIEIRGTKLAAGVYIWYRGIEPSTPLYNWEDGYNMTGTEIIGDEEAPPDPQKLDILLPTVVQLDEDPQVHVNDIGVGDQATYEIRGNSKNGTLTYTIEGESPVNVLTWVDGLVTTPEDTNIPIPAPAWPPVGWSEMEISICISGVPTTKIILVKD